MSRIKVAMATKKDKTDKLINNLKEGNVKVGWFEKDKHKNGLYVAEIAFLNENGHEIKRNGKTIARVPPRPFLAITMADNNDRWQFFWKKLYKQVLDGKLTLQLALNKLGEIVRTSIKDTIWSNVPPPNAPSTIKHKKGRTTTLIDTGKMLQTINYETKVGK